LPHEHINFVEGLLLKLFCITDSNVSRKYPHAFGKKERCIDVRKNRKSDIA
jgi:hypothetical protein